MNEPNVICVYGYEESLCGKLKSWLDSSQDHFLVFIDEEASLLLRFSPPNPKIRLFILNSENTDEVLRKIAWEFLFLPFAYEAKTEKGKKILAKLADIQGEIQYFASDFDDQGLKLYRNLTLNLSKPSFLGHGLQNAYKNIPAIICGAGPSLMKNGALLRSLSDQAVILAGGAAIAALNQLEVPYHFGAQIDSQSAHDLRTRKAPCNAPLFCQLRTDPELLSMAKGPLLCMEGGGNYPLEKWMCEWKADFDGGWTVGTFCTAIAAFLGCNPIIFVGMDLSCSKSTMYAMGIEKKAAKDRLVSVKNKKGETVYSQKDWLFAAEWIEGFAKNHPHYRFINATEGGLGFQGIEDLTLKEVGEKFLTEKRDITLNYEALSKMDPHVMNRMGSLKESLQKSQQLVEEILREMKTIFPKHPSSSGKCALLEKDLSEQVAAKHLLEPIWNIWKYPILRRNEAGEYGIFLNQLLFYRSLIGNHLQ